MGDLTFMDAVKTLIPVVPILSTFTLPGSLLFKFGKDAVMATWDNSRPLVFYNQICKWLSVMPVVRLYSAKYVCTEEIAQCMKNG